MLLAGRPASAGDSMSRFAPASPFSLDPSAAHALRAGEALLAERQGSWPRTALVFSPAGSIYHGYPFLFLPAFPRAPTEATTTLALATRYLYDSIFVADALMDGEYEDQRLTGGTLQLQVLQLEAYALLWELFPPGTPFWVRFRERMAAYVEACHEERQLAAPGARWRFDEDSARRMATGKCALAKVAVDGLTEIAGGDSPSTSLCQALDGYYVARQMIDDLSDWRVDLERGFPSLLLARVSQSAFDGDREAMAADVKRTARAIYLEGHAEASLGVGLDALDDAERRLDGLPSLPFDGPLRTLRCQYESVLAETEAITRPRQGPRPQTRALPAEDEPWRALAHGALGLLLDRPEESVPVSPLERAFRLEALTEADRELDGSLADVVAAECDRLIAERLRSFPGGWRFSRIAPGLPADLWSSAQAALALVRANRRSAARQCLDLGAWTSRPGDLPDLWASVGRSWRRPPFPEPDVMATATWLRLLEALGVDDPAMSSARRWLIERQRADGSWRCAGAAGPLLPTAAAVQALAAADSGAPVRSLERAWDFLRESQSPGGGWRGKLEEADPCSTALALLAMASLSERSPSPEIDERAIRARSWLARSEMSAAPSDSSRGRLLSASFLLRASLCWSGAHILSAAEADRAPTVEEAV